MYQSDIKRLGEIKKEKHFSRKMSINKTEGIIELGKNTSFYHHQNQNRFRQDYQWVRRPLSRVVKEQNVHPVSKWTRQIT